MNPIQNAGIQERSDGESDGDGEQHVLYDPEETGDLEMKWHRAVRKGRLEVFLNNMGALLSVDPPAAASQQIQDFLLTDTVKVSWDRVLDSRGGNPEIQGVFRFHL